MAEPVSATFIGPDLAALTKAILDAVPYAQGMPDKMNVKWVDKKPTEDWREKLLAKDVDGLGVSWKGLEITRDAGMVTAAFPITWKPEAILDAVAAFPFELVKLSATDAWTKLDYKAPSIAGTRLGWAMIVKGDAHERYFASRRWLEYGPFRSIKGAHDTTFVQFCEPEDGEKSIAQAKPGHEWIEAGFIKAKHRFKHDIKGVRTKDDRLLRIVVNDRKVSDAELLDACAARRDDDDIDNIAYVFVDEHEAKANVERLWLRELECRYAGPSGEKRIDESFTPKLERPAWS
jgi:hypothetical protein